MTAGWALLVELDPAVWALILRQTLRAAIIEATANQIATAAKAENVSGSVQAAEREVQDALTELFGKPVTINDDDDDGWQFWKDGYEHGKRYQSSADMPELKKEKKPDQGNPFPGE